LLEVKNLHKTFGDFVAVKDVSFTIHDGEILGLIGQNGAGKTTTFRMILDFLKKEKGSVLWNGLPLDASTYNTIGYLPEERGLYMKETIESQLYYFASLRGKNKKEIDPLIDDYMEKFQVKGKRKDKVKSLSKGNQQKVQLIATLIHDPKLVILDEPFSGLDPVNASILKDGILELKEKGASVIFSSHNMDNVEQICDELVMLRSGEMVLDGKVSDIRNSFGRTKLYVESSFTKAELENLDGVEQVEEKEMNQFLLTLENESFGKNIFETIVARDKFIPVFNQEPPTLEEIFKMKAGEPNE
jgi:ABC-2 type transport system ATP-binding protein